MTNPNISDADFDTLNAIQTRFEAEASKVADIRQDFIAANPHLYGMELMRKMRECCPASVVSPFVNNPNFDQQLVSAFFSELSRRRNKAEAVRNAIPAGTYALGEVVEVHAFGHWYRGEVTKLGRTKVTVKYTSGTGVTREKAVDSAKIRKAA